MSLLTKIDITILDFLQRTIKSSFLDKIMTTISNLGNMGILWIILILIFLTTKEYKKMAKIMIFSLIINIIIVNLILKPFISRQRPFELVRGVKLLVLKPTDASFPSGHSAISFCMLTVTLLFSKSKTINIMTSILAILIAFSRLYLYVHYPSDVIGGLILGIVCAILGIKLYFSKIGKAMRKAFVENFNLKRKKQ